MNKREPLRYTDYEAGPEEPVSENPVRDRLERIHEHFAVEANEKESRAEDLEREAHMLRAEARGLRVAQEGVSKAIGAMKEAYEENAKREAARTRDSDTNEPYDARAHSNRYPG